MPPEPGSEPGRPLSEGEVDLGTRKAEARQQRLEQELWQSHQRFRAILDTTSDGYWTATTEGRITDVNAAYCRMSGYSREEMLGKAVQDFDVLDDLERIRERTEQLKREGSIRFQSQHRTKDGQLLDLEISLTLVSPAGEVVAFLRDLTEQNRTKVALFETQRRFKALVQQSWDILSILDAEGRLVYNSPACERIHGFTPDDLLGRLTAELLHPEDAPRMAEAMAWTLAHPGVPITVEYRYACKDGHWVWMEAVAVNQLEDPAIRGIVVNSREISDRKGAEEALRASEAMYREMLEHQGEGLGVVDAEERFVFANAMAEHIFGVAPGGLTGRSILDFLGEPGAHQVKAETQTRRTGRSSTYELEIQRPGGERRLLLVTATPRPLEASTNLQVIGVFRDITEHKLTEEALQENELLFRRLVEGASVPIGVANARGQIEYLNPRFLQEFAYSREELTDMEAWWNRAFPDPAYREEAQRVLAQAVARAEATHSSDISMDALFRVTCGDGQVRLVKMNAALAGARTIVFMHDLTERVRSEEALRDALELSEQLVSSQPMGIASFHAESGRCVRVNEAMARILGGTVEGILAQNFWQLPSWRESGLLTAARLALETGAKQQVEGQTRSSFGKSFWFSGVMTTFKARGELHLLVMFDDISARKEAEWALRKASAAVEQSPAGILITDTRGTIEYVNTAFTSITGYAREEALGQNPRMLQSGAHDRAFYQDLWDTVLAGRTWVGQVQNRRRDGVLIWEETTISPLRNEAGEITHFVSSSLDITEALAAAEAQRRLEEQLVRTQKLESLGSLAGGVAHDMNNVLGAIMGLASLHQDALPEGSDLRRDMDTIVKACERGGTLVKGLLGFARKGLAQEQDVDLNDLVREEVALLSRTTLQRVQLDMDLASGLPLVRGDVAALSHVLMNLCVNAVDAMAGRGQLSLHTRNPGNGYVVLEVVDTGCGMAKDVLDKALDPFFTTKPHGKGTGLGLPIVYATVKAHRGHMELDSTPGEGTRVAIFLPAAEPALERASRDPEPRRETPCLKVLLVDDDELVQDSVGQMLSALGHHPTVVGSGEAALRLLENHQVVDLVILDLNMPGLGGAGTLPRLRALRPQLPVLLATGRVDQDALDLVEGTSGVALLPKPFNLAEVRRRIESFTGGT